MTWFYDLVTPRFGVNFIEGILCASRYEAKISRQNCLCDVTSVEVSSQLKRRGTQLQVKCACHWR